MKQSVVLAFGLTAAFFSFAAVGQQPGAAPTGAPGGGPNPENFEKVKAVTLKDRQARIQILQHAASCIQAAGEFPQLRACDQKEREARKQMRDQMRGEMESMRAQRRQGRPEK